MELIYGIVGFFIGLLFGIVGLKFILNKIIKNTEDKYIRNQLNNNKELYSEIEYLIIKWYNDGTKTAGFLTRQIMKLLNKS
jgi:hypothetical protein